MQGPSPVVVSLERLGPLAGDAGGLLFFAYWSTRSRAIALPPMVAVLLDLATLVLMTTAVLGYQLIQDEMPRAWVGWAGVAAVGLGFGGSLPLLCAGLVLFGLSVTWGGVFPQLPGWLLVVGGLVLMMGWTYASNFGRAFARPSPWWEAAMGAALVMVAAALADLDVLGREQRTRR
ncbi:MAG TPA: hypothetical protein VGN48_17240 [Pedococcus sp.]|jgi:hypothetical protein|nr:hypothetical protein [Pedococcus sp.]